MFNKQFEEHKFKKGYIPWNKGKDSRTKTKCDFCGIFTLKDRWCFNRARHHFCSPACQQKFDKGYPRKYKNGHPMLGKTGELSPNWKGGLPDCMDCGKKLNRKQSYSSINGVAIKANRKRCKSCNYKYYIREKAWNWMGGKSFEPYPLGWTKTFKEQIRKRDNYKCRICGVPEIECDRKLDIHHIDFNKNNLSHDNLISLCRKCHSRILFDKEYWTKNLIYTIRKENIYGS